LGYEFKYHNHRPMPPRKRVQRPVSDADDLDHQYTSAEEDSYEDKKENKKRGRPRKKPKHEDSDEEFFHKLNREVEEDEEEGVSDIETPPKVVKTNFEAGQIVKIYVENFMCHRKFTINLGQGLNFICGKNGSG
jgi:structural maintenance of chromosomes protein 6